MNMRLPADLPMRTIYLAAGLISLMLSAWLASQLDIINPDAICYVLSAKQAGESGVSAAMHLCGQASWPFYSLLIYAFSKISSLSLVTSALTLNATFTLVSVLTFLAIVARLGASRRVMWLAAFVILTAHQFNSVRDYIIRDHGFWAFYLLSLYSLLRFMQEKKLLFALAFGASMATAALFRIEGAVFLLLLPLMTFLQTATLRTRVSDFIKLNLIGLAAGCVLAVFVMTHPASLEKLGRLPELFNQALHGITTVRDMFHMAVNSLRLHLLPQEAARDAGMIWLSVLVVMFFWNILSNLSLIAAALFIYALYSGAVAHFSRAAKLVLGSYILLNMMIGAAFFAQRLFFSKRYLIALTLVFLLYVPFALDKLFSAKRLEKRWLALAAMVILFGASLGVFLNLGTSKLFIRDAGSYVAETLPANARLYVNDIQLGYYTGRDSYQLFANSRRQHEANYKIDWQAYDYYACVYIISRQMKY